MIARFLRRNPRILLLTITVIVISGVSSFLVMPRLEDPVLGRRVAVITTAFPGASAARVESLITIPLEEQLSGISEIKQVRSNSLSGISNIVIELNDNVYEVDPVWSIVRDRVAVLKNKLPESCTASEVEVVPLKAFAAIISVQSNEGDSERRLTTARRHAQRLKADIIAIAGTEKVDVFGDPGEEFLVEVSPTSLASTGLSTSSIASQISGSLTDLPAGRISQDGGNLELELQNSPLPIDRIQDSLITYGPKREIKPLSELAMVRKQPVTPGPTEAIIDGQPAIVLGAMVSDDLRLDLWADRLDETLTRFQTMHENVTCSVLFSQRQHVDQRMEMLLKNLAGGTAAVVLVVLLMMGWRSMIVVAIALPLSALMVLSVMRVMSIPIHQMSATGLIVAMGLLIDNAIVIVEDVRSRILRGAHRSIAVVEGVRHLAVPLFGSTLTTALAFLPIATLPGPPGEFVGTIAVSVILAISASFLLAMTVIPALVGILSNDSSGAGTFTRGLHNAAVRAAYEYSLRVVYRTPLVGLVLGTVLPAVGFLLVAKLPEQFFPASDRDQIQIELELPARESIETTRATVERVSAIAAEFDEVDRQHWFLGGSAPTFFYNVVPRRRGTPFYAQAFVDLVDCHDAERLVRSLQAAIDERIPAARTVVRLLEQGPPFDAPVEIRVLGPEPATLQRLGSELRTLLSDTPHVIHTRSDFEETIPRLALTVDSTTALKAGLNKSQLAGLLYTTLEGASAGAVYDGNEDVPVRVKLAMEGQFQLQQLAALPLPSMQSQAAPRQTGSGADGIPGLSPLTLASVTTRELTSDVGAIVRIDGHRANEVKAYIQAEVLPSSVVENFQRNLDQSGFKLPEGYSIEFGGENEQRTQAVNKLIANGFVLFALILLTLVASFRSFRCAFIIAVVGGLSSGLGPLMLAWFGYPFGFMAIVGTMGLVGVAINDSIVVLAAIRANDYATTGNRREIIRVVVHCTRHILATTFTTIVGFLPLILGGGGFWPPLAVTIAGGVGGATFLALYFTPSLYLLLFGQRQH